MAGYLFVAWTIIFLVGLFVFSLINLPEFGFASLFWMALSGYSLFKIIQLMRRIHKKGATQNAQVDRPKTQNPLSGGHSAQADR